MKILIFGATGGVGRRLVLEPVGEEPWRGTVLDGVFAFMGIGGAVVWASVWGDGDLERAERKAEDLAERLASRVGHA